MPLHHVFVTPNSAVSQCLYLYLSPLHTPVLKILKTSDAKLRLAALFYVAEKTTHALKIPHVVFPLVVS